MKLKHTISLLLFSCLFYTNFSNAQLSSDAVIGTVINTTNAPLEAVAITVLHPKDSTYIKYTITDSKGLFKFEELTPNSYLLQLSSLGYKSIYKEITYTKEQINLKNIILEEDLMELDGITLTAVVPMQIKQDTVSFNASSFKTNPDDNLEELLNKLPGVDIDSDGKVNAQGDEVAKIMVDGKEFFGGDPAVVLKNLSADDIYKIEIIDQKSEETQLTGVADGNKEVVINFTLKKTKKSKGFGKASAGVGLDKRYFTNLNYNKFTSKTQFAVIGKFNNINITGSNIQGFLKNTNGIDESEEEDSNSAKRTKSLSGFLKTGVAGFNLGHEFKKKEDFNIDYFYNLSENIGNSKSKRITFSSNNNFDYIADNNYSNSTNNHNLNFNYKNKSHENYRLFIKGRFRADNVISELERDGKYFLSENILATTNFNKNNIEKNKTFSDVNINYFQKLNNYGRNFNIGFNSALNNSKLNNTQNTFIERGLNTNKINSREINTLRDESTNNITNNVTIKYTEPLGGNHSFKFESYIKNDRRKEDVNQFKTTIKTTPEEEILQYNYKHILNSYQNRLAHSYNISKLNTYLGLELQNIDRVFGVKQEPFITANNFYLNPITFLQYKPKKGKRFRVSYKKTVRSPNSYESSTVINDLNPFSIRKGNPFLEPEKIDFFSLLGITHNFKSGINFNSKIQYQNSNNGITRSVEVDDDFIKTTSYANNGKKSKFTSSLNFSKKMKKIGLRYTLKNRNFFTTSNSIINLQSNEVNTKDYTFRAQLENNNKRIIDIKAGAIYSINNTTFSIEKDLDRKFSKQQYFSMVDYDISKKLNFNTQFDYIVYKDNKFTSDQKLPLWNATLSYAFSDKKNDILKLVLIDLLDKNVDIYRNSTINFFEETTSESLGRYIILSFTHRLNKSQNKKS
ncbi:outer membrane beta-barrel protein [uncultured Maribacter sp.]|uniref:outer membrane beta-barrel protein n=1 Tax=uncultured Maribacter sp. TaxID=431308 RepID=UPI0026130464|nr:outer membrane beta-barrel protein [uncultured Maribacter sp.]